MARSKEWINIGDDIWEHRGSDSGEQSILHRLDIGDVIGVPVEGKYTNEEKGRSTKP